MLRALQGLTQEEAEHAGIYYLDSLFPAIFLEKLRNRMDEVRIFFRQNSYLECVVK